MESYRKSLPPLDTLVFFDAVMRQRSFTRAAEGLYVSQAAVSKRVRQLEDWLGTPLFVRGTRRLTPTQAGLDLAQKVAVTLDYLEVAVTAARAPAPRAVTIAANSAVAMFWLQPRLRAFALGEAACSVNIVTTDQPGPLLAQGHDLAIVYGSGRLPGWRAERILDEVLAPVAAPALAARLGPDLSGAPEAPLLDYQRLAPDWIDWGVWGRRTGQGEVGQGEVGQGEVGQGEVGQGEVGRDGLLARPRADCASYVQSIGRALAGGGIALGSLALLAPELASGALVRVGRDTLRTGLGYDLCHPESRAPSEDTQRLRAFLTGGAPGTGAG